MQASRLEPVLQLIQALFNMELSAPLYLNYLPLLMVNTLKAQTVGVSSSDDFDLWF